MFKHRLMLSAAVTALFAVPALANHPTTITDKKTEQVKTSTADNGNPDDVTIGANGSIVINAAGPALLIDSNNIVDNEGTISNKDKDGAQGVLIDATGTAAPNLGPFGPPPAGSTDFFKTNGIIDLTGKGAGKTGFVFKGGTSAAIAQVTGDFDFTPSSQLLINGDNSVGISLQANSKLIGNLNTLGIITLNQTTATDTSGSGLIGIDLAGEVTKNFKVGGQVNVIGQSGTGILVTPTGVVDGVFWNTGTIFSTGVQLPDNKSVNPEGGSAVVINGNILGGFYNQGPTSTADTTTAGVISMQGTGSAVAILPGVGGTADITLGAIDDSGTTSALGFADPSNTGNKFGFINHGSILAAPIDANQSAAVIGMQIGGSTLFRTIVQNGILNTGQISAASSSASSVKTPAAAGAAIGLELAQLADVPKIVNQSFGATGSGTISAAVTGSAGGSAVGILIAQTAIPIDTTPAIAGTGGNAAGNNVLGHLEIDNLSGGQILASATTSDPSNATLSAVAIQDLSGKLTKIVNEGTISAVASILTKNNQKAVAIDARANTAGIDIEDGVVLTGHTGTIIGDVLLGSGSDVVTVSGLDASNKSSLSGVLNFGSNTAAGAGGANDQLIINPFATVSSAIQSSDGHLDVSVANNGVLVLNDAALPTPAPTILHSLLINTGGELDLTVAQGLGDVGLIQAQNDGTTTGSITLQTGAKLNVTFGSFIDAGKNFVLLDAPNGQLTIPDAAAYEAALVKPFLFDADMCTVNVAPPTIACAAGTTTSTHSQLLLTFTPKTAADLQLTGYAAQMYPIVTQVLPKDNALGAAVVAGVTDNASAQQVFDGFAPVVNGGSKALAVAFTDQATGPIGARQRILRTYGKQPGESTLWAVEYAQFLKDPGSVGSSGVDSTGAPTASGLLTGFKDHGFGFSIGGDGGSASDGWYGGALSFYTGDIGGLGTPVALNQSQTEWYMLSGYTDWRGRGLFFDTNLDVGVTQYKTKRILNIVTAPSTTFSRTAQSKHIGVFLAGGVTTGAILKYSGTTITPQISIDGLTMRENGYTEAGSPTTGDGFDLAVGAAYTNSLRSFLGVDLRQDIDLGDFFLQPEGRVGYRYDFIGSPQKVTANFVSLPGTTFTVNGPDPSQGNIVAGASISASTDTWSIGVSYDWVRGSNGATQQSGQFVLVGRI